MNSVTDVANASLADVANRLRSALSATSVDDQASTLDSYSHDTWPVATVWAKLDRHPQRPDLVVRVSTPEEVAVVLTTAAEAGVPVTSWGLGSSVTGQPLPTRGGVVLDLSGLVGEPVLADTDRTVTAPAGVRGSDLEAWLNERGYTLNHFPQSLGRSTIGGWVATRATGQYSSRYGGVEELVTAYTVVLIDGTVCHVGQRPRAAMGPDLKHLFMGSEGTLGVVTEVTMKVFAQPEFEIVEAFSLPNLEAGLTAMRQFTQAGLRPHLVRCYDADEAKHALHENSVQRPVMFIGCQGVADVAQAEHAAITRLVAAAGGEGIGPQPVLSWLERRFDFSTVEKLLAERGGYAETVEVANMWSRIHPMYEDLKTALAPLADEVLGHFSHVYDQGTSLYVILLGRAADDETALARLEEIWRTAMAIVVRHDGEVSHHHGGGLARQPWARQSLGSGHVLLSRIKDALDPDHLLNPGKLGLDE